MNIFLALSYANLLSGRELGDCVNGTDPTCVTGVAHFDALRRQLIPSEAPTLVLPLIDQKSAFISRHPLSFSVNRVVLQEILNYELYTGFVLLTQQDPDVYDDSPMQSKDFPLLMSDVELQGTNSWNFYLEQIHYDPKTHIALIAHMWTGTEFHVDPVEVTKMLLDEIAARNIERGCIPEQRAAELQFDTYIDKLALYDENGNNVNSNNNTEMPNNQQETSSFCWIPVVVLGGFSNGQVFLDGIVPHHNPPAAIILAPNAPNLFLNEHKTPTRLGNTWVCSITSNPRQQETYAHVQMQIDDNSTKVQDFEVVERPLDPLPAGSKDEIYHDHIAKINLLQQDILENNPVVGYTTEVEEYYGPGQYRCFAGECSIGNLFTDAMRWKTGSQLSFLSSIFFLGSGWPAGPVRVNQIWDALKWPQTVCTGKVSGLTLFRLFNFSTSVNTFNETVRALFDGESLQVSGMRYTYNAQLEGTRLISMEVWDEEAQTYQPVERLKVYNVTTTTWNCRQRQPFASMLSAKELTLPGEEPFRVWSVAQHQVVTEYLSATSSQQVPLDISPSGRIREDISSLTPLNFIQNADSCEPGTTWIESRQSCQTCPDASSQIQWSREVLELEAISNSESGPNDNVTISLLNGAPFPVTVSPRSLPSWLVNVTSTVEQLDFESGETVQTFATMQESVALATGDRLALQFAVSAVDLEPGRVVSSVSFGVLDGGDLPGCDNQDASFDVSLRVIPEDNLNQLGNIRYVGWVLSLVVLLSASLCASVVILRRKHRLVRFMQPTFLVLICVGVATMGLALITLSFDDEIVSTEAMDFFCMTTPWLLSLGFSVTFSALLSKLWRVNQLFHAASHLRHAKVEAKDAAVPFAAIFLVNIITLLVWSAADPLRWSRKMINNEEWDTYGVCESDGGNNVGYACAVVVILLNLVALAAACYQAYKARALNSELSESKNMGIALYSWLQLVVVSAPVLFVIDDNNVEARFYVQAGMIFAVSMTMLLCLFAPLLARKDLHVSEEEHLQSEEAPRSSMDKSGIPRSSADRSGVGGIHVSVAGLNRDTPGTMKYLSTPNPASEQMQPLEEDMEGEEHANSSAPARGEGDDPSPAAIDTKTGESLETITVDTTDASPAGEVVAGDEEASVFAQEYVETMENGGTV